MLENLLRQFAPAMEPLQERVCLHVDDRMLKEIALADYGDDFDKHLEQLISIKNGAIPSPMHWHPREVLELTRWTEIEETAAEDVRERNHWMRLFVCTALLRADVDPKNDDAYHWSDDSTVIQLVESALALGSEIVRAALSFFCWCMLQEREDEEAENCFLALGVLLLAVAIGQCDQTTAEGLVAASTPEYIALADWLKRSQRAQKWTALADQILVASSETNDISRQYGEHLVHASRHS